MEPLDTPLACAAAFRLSFGQFFPGHAETTDRLPAREDIPWGPVLSDTPSTVGFPSILMAHPYLTRPLITNWSAGLQTGIAPPRGAKASPSTLTASDG